MTDQELYEKRIEAVKLALVDTLPVLLKFTPDAIERAARAADAATLQAIAEPTDGMINADEKIAYAWKYNHALDWQYGGYPDAEKRGYAIGRVWRALLGAIPRGTP